MEQSPIDLERLQQLASAGDESARAELCRRFYPRVQELVHRELESDFRRQHRWLLPLFSTGDIVQEVFLAVVSGLDGFEVTDEDAFARYLSTLVHHRLVDALRHHESAKRDARRLASPAAESSTAMPVAELGAARDPSPSLAAAIGEQLELFRAVLDGFGDRDRALLQLRLLDADPWQQIAERLGYPSADAARKAFHQVEARLLLRLRARGVRPPTIGRPRT